MGILDTARDKKKLFLKEISHHNKLKSQLNVQKSLKPFNFIIDNKEIKISTLSKLNSVYQLNFYH
jgi:hypothetical protein